MSRPPASAPVDITPPKPVSYQLRLTIWNTSDVELNDENFITGRENLGHLCQGLDSGRERRWSTDRYSLPVSDFEGRLSKASPVFCWVRRSLTGEGNFNWRFLFDFNYLEIEEKIVHEKRDSLFQVGNVTKKIPPRIIIRVYDADLLSADDFLGQFFVLRSSALTWKVFSGECILNLTHLPLARKQRTNAKQRSSSMPSIER